MSTIPQISMFCWEKEIEILGDLARLKLVLENLPDEELMRTLEKERGRGRNDYPACAMWNLLIAMLVLGHDTQAGVCRELSRNMQLRYLCGFGSFQPLPGETNLSRFIATLEKHEEDVLGVFIALSDQLYELLPDFGKTLAIDSKWTWSKANRKSERKNPDGRSETDAEWGVKEYSGVKTDGTRWSSKKKCFGFKTHLIVDATYELPVAFCISGADGSDVKWGKELLREIREKRPHVILRCKYLLGDKGYDSEELIRWLQDEQQRIRAVIDKRTMWKNEQEKELPGQPGRYYDEQGNVFCYSPQWGERHRMIPVGYDKDRKAQRFRCPAAHYGSDCCRESCSCALAKTIRVPLQVDARIFTEVGRTQYMWKRIYAKRTSVERVNSRLDVSFGFEARRVRGTKKMKLFATLTFAVMNALATGSIMAGKPERMRSLMRAA